MYKTIEQTKSTANNAIECCYISRKGERISYTIKGIHSFELFKERVLEIKQDFVDSYIRENDGFCMIELQNGDKVSLTYFTDKN